MIGRHLLGASNSSKRIRETLEQTLAISGQGRRGAMVALLCVVLEKCQEDAPRKLKPVERWEVREERQ